MTLPFQTPPSSADHKQHQQRINACRGYACVEELFRAFSTRSITQLEVLIDERVLSTDAEGIDRGTGKYRQWRNGSAPSDASADLAASRSGGRADVRKWRDLPLWILLSEPLPLSISQLHELMASLSLPVRSAVFLAPGPNAMGRYHRHPLSRDEMLDLADLGTLDAFIGLLALAREGELINDDQRHSVPSIFAFGIFAKILRSHPHLEVAWEKLYDSLVFAFWSRWYGEGISPGFKKQYIVTHRADLAIDESALCMIGGGRKITLAREV